MERAMSIAQRKFDTSHSNPPDEATQVKPKVVKMSPKATPRAASSIAFPYMDLENAISVARAILNSGGVGMSREQLAGAMKQSATSGAFILKVSAGRMF